MSQDTHHKQRHDNGPIRGSEKIDRRLAHRAATEHRRTRIGLTAALASLPSGDYAPDKSIIELAFGPRC